MKNILFSLLHLVVSRPVLAQGAPTHGAADHP